MTELIWPWRLLLPTKGQKTRLVGQSLSGTTSLDGSSQTARTDGGGRWMSDLSGIWLYDANRIRAARAWSAMLDGGVTSFVLPIWDLAFAPTPSIGGVAALPGAPLIDNTNYFNQEPGFGSPLISATVAAAAALRATTVQITVAVGTNLLGGEHFSIQHPDKDWRFYRVGQVTAVSGSTYTCTIRPPLRQALAGGEVAEFDVPRCLMKLVAGKADSLEPDIQVGNLAMVDGYFEEAT